MLRAYRMHGPLLILLASAAADAQSELLWQIKNFHSFCNSGGCYSDFSFTTSTNAAG